MASEPGDLLGTIPLSPDEELRVSLCEEDGRRTLRLERCRRSRWGEGYAEAGEALVVPASVEGLGAGGLMGFREALERTRAMGSGIGL